MTTIDTIDIELFGDIDEIIKNLQAVKLAYPEAISITVDQEWTGYEDCHEEINIVREETDEETSDRLTGERETKEREIERREKQITKGKEALELLKAKQREELKEAEKAIPGRCK